MDGEITRESVMLADSDGDDADLRPIQKISRATDTYPDAFVHAIRHSTVASMLTSSSSSTSSLSRPQSVSSDESNESSTYQSNKEPKLREQLTMIPESVIAALTNIQRSQLRRVREDTSAHLEDILRNVVKTVDVFYADQVARELFIPAKKLIGHEDNEETRIKEEIRKILHGDIGDGVGRENNKNGKKEKKSVEKKEKEGTEEEERNEEEQTGEIVTVCEQVEEPVCQVMFNIIDDLRDISNDRQALLTEVLEWMAKYPLGSLPGDFDNVPDEIEQYDEKVFTNWEVTKNIRRLTMISQEMGLAKFEDTQESEVKEEEAKGDDKRNLLEEKMNRQRARFVAPKVFDAEALAEPKNWRSASITINHILEDASTTSNSPRGKQMLSNAYKQFRVMTELAEKRQEEKLKLELQLNSVIGKLNKEKKEAKSLRKQKQKLESQLEKYQDDIIELKKDVNTRDEMIKERTDQIYELEALNEEQEQALINERESRKRQAPPIMQPVIPAQQQQQAQEEQPLQTNQQPGKTNAMESKEEIPNSDKLHTTNQGTKQKTKKKASKEGGLKVKKENKEEEKRRKQEREKERQKEEAQRTSVVMSLKEAKAELEELRKAGEARENLVKELRIKVEAETAKFEQEKAKLEEEIQFHKLQTEGAKKQLAMEQEAWERAKNEMLQEKDRLNNEVQAKEEIINFQEQRIQEVAREMTLSLMRAGLQANTSTVARGNATDKLLESKQMLAKLHLQYEYEMQKLRRFVKRESERHQAETRRLETEYKANLNNIYRDTSVIFRAVNRFKECLAVLFDRENLADAAHSIRNLPNLLEDESLTDPHIKLLKMAGSITELMVQMEFKMSQALMNKRIEMKDNSLEKNFLAKDLEAREELLKKAKELGNLQAEKLKQAREEISSQEVELLKLKHSETDKYVDMMERNKELTRQNQILNKELTYLQKELQEETSSKENQRHEMDKVKTEMKKTIEQQTSVIERLKSENARILSEQKLHLKKSDMMRNIKLLNDALEAKKISHHKHLVAMTMIEKTMDVTGARLACFVRKYILHKRWKKICEAMRERHKSNKRPAKVEKYLKKMEQRIAEKKTKLGERKAEILQKKTDIYMQFKHMCNELRKEHGVHLVRPTVQKVRSMPSVPHLPEQESMDTKRQDQLKKMLRRPNNDPGSLDGIQGFQFFAPEAPDTTSWQFPSIESTQSTIVTPRILDMDMKKARESCQRVLTSKSCGTFDDSGLKAPWCRTQKIRESLFSLPPIASLYPEN